MLPNWLYGKSLRKLQEILNSGGQTAAGTSYSNTASGLEATNTQDAIDEIVEELDTKAAQSALTTLSDTVTTLTGTVNGKVGWSDYAQLGAVNYCKNNATTTTTTDGTTTFTWTVNDDKSVTVSAPSYPITTAGTIGIEVWNNITPAECEILVGKTFILSGCPSGGNTNSYELQAYRVESTNGSSGTVQDYGDGATFTWLNNGNGTKAKIVIQVKGNVTLTEDLTFYPMIAPASYTGSYVPYAKTNAELTDDVMPVELAYTASSIESATSLLHIYKTGKTIHIGGYMNVTSALTKGDTLFSLTDGKPKNKGYAIVGLTNSDTDFRVIFFDTSGSVKVESDSGLSAGYYVINATYITS